MGRETTVATHYCPLTIHHSPLTIAPSLPLYYHRSRLRRIQFADADDAGALFLGQENPGH